MNRILETIPFVSLIGYRGTGKTTVARRLGERLNWPWLDADVELERRAGKTIREIFEQDGETAFRDWETMVVLDLTRRKHVVLAWGGGAIMRDQNRAAIRQGLVIWLQADPGTIWERTLRDPTTAGRRPNLTTGGLAEIESLLLTRTPYYRECADHSIDTTGQTPDQIAEEIVCLVRARVPEG